MASEAPTDEQSAPLSLLDLPDACLLAVLQCCAADSQRSLFSAARAHSRLHQAALRALSRITVHVYHQQQLDRVLLYLSKHGQHVGHLKLKAEWLVSISMAAVLRELPPSLQLSSLEIEGEFVVQLRPGHGFRGVLGSAAAAAALKELRLCKCKLFDDNTGLAQALALLPGLQHLSIDTVRVGYIDSDRSDQQTCLPGATLQWLQQLTYLELGGLVLTDTGAALALQPLQALTRLVDLRIQPYRDLSLTASMLSGTSNLTRLELYRCSIESAVLAGKTQLLHLELSRCMPTEGAAGVAQLLSHLQPMQQLTELHLDHCLQAVEAGTTPATAYSALTASSKLQQLNLRDNTLPAGVWQHAFPAGRQLPHLCVLYIDGVREPGGNYAPSPDGSSLASCCPSLQHLDMSELQYHTQLLAPLQGLSGLRTLLFDGAGSTGEGLEAVLQMTGLTDLTMVAPEPAEGLLLQLTQLKLLEHLDYYYQCSDGHRGNVYLFNKYPGDMPVWRKILKLNLKNRDPQVAQQAAAILEDEGLSRSSSGSSSSSW